MRTSFSRLTGCAHTRYGWKGATHRRTPIVTRTRNATCRKDFDGVLAAAAPRRLPRTQSWDGMVVHNYISPTASPLAGMLATAVHTVAYLAVTGLLAWVVYRKLGLALLRKAWFNFDLVWAAALMATGVVTLLI